MTIVEFGKDDNPPIGLRSKLHYFKIPSSIERVRSFRHTKLDPINEDRQNTAVVGHILNENSLVKTSNWNVHNFRCPANLNK